MEHGHSKNIISMASCSIHHSDMPSAGNSVYRGQSDGRDRMDLALKKLESDGKHTVGAITSFIWKAKGLYLQRKACKPAQWTIKEGVKYLILGVFGVSVLMGLVSAAYAQESPAFLGVPIVQANRNNLTKSILANKGERKTTVKKGEGEPKIEDYVFPSGLLPSGIRWVRFYYDDKGQLIMLEAKVPTKSLLERKKDDTAESEMMRLLETKYGRAKRVKDYKNAVGMVSQEYTWHFNDLSSIVLGSDSALKGQSLKYVNNRLVAQQKANLENAQSDKF